jgi:hypothetical protein
MAPDGASRECDLPGMTRQPSCVAWSRDFEIECAAAHLPPAGSEEPFAGILTSR